MYMNELKIKKNGIPTLLNFLGLGIAFTVFLILMSQVWWDFRYDRFKGGRDVYIVEYPSGYDGQYTSQILRPVVPMVRDCSPGILTACDYVGTVGDKLGRIQIKDQSGEYVTARDINFGVTETAALDVFGVTMVAGRREDFAAKGDALISEKTAARYFPDRNPVGETIIYNWRYEYRIVGIYKDRKENETLVNGILIHEGETDLALPNTQQHACYVRLAPGADLAAVRQAVGKVGMGSSVKNLRLTNLHDHWFMIRHDIWGRERGGNKTMCYILLTIALLFLAVATFNYINFAMASIPFRIRDINTRKVYGASRISLVLRQLLRSAGIVGAAFLAGILAMRTLSGTEWATFLSGSMVPGENLPVVLLGGAVAVAVALVAGLIPALYSTSFQPALVLKGAFSMTARGGGLRTVTLVLQYVLSFLFILSALILQRQTTFMARNDALGFDHDYVLKMESVLYDRVEDVESRIADLPGVVDVTRGESPIQSGLSSRGEIRDNDRIVQYSFRNVPPDYPGFFKLEIADGRLPLPGEKGVALVNESFAEALPSYGLGKILEDIYGDESQIIGILKDFHARSLQHAYAPLVLFIDGDLNYASFMIRVRHDADVEGILGQARSIYAELKELDKEEIETGFLDRDIEKLYEQELRQTRLIRYSSLLSLLIALVGVLGLVWFDIRFMRKEVALRKVNGATARDILSKINLKYLVITLVGFVVAAPLAYAVCQRWMSQFAFRTNIPAGIFLASLLAVAAVTLAGVTLQSWRAANANPVDAIKNE